MAVVGAKRLFLQDLSVDHLRLLNGVVQYAADTTVEEWLERIAEGKLEVYALDGALLGIYNRSDKLVVEFLAGRNLVRRGSELRDWLKEGALGRPIEFWTPRPGMVKLAQRCGFTPVATWMRMGGASKRMN